MLLLKICLSFFLLFCFQSQSSLFSLSPFSFFQKSNPKKRKHPLATKSHLSVPNKMKTRLKHNRMNPSAPSLNKSLNQDMEDDFIIDEIINSQKKNEMETLLECRIYKEKIKGHYKCDICQTTYLAKPDLLAHKQKLHKNTPSLCFFCEESLNNLYETRQHYKNHHPEQETVCEHCGKIFISKYTAQTHKEPCRMKQQIEKNPSKCVFCLESLNDPSELNSHCKDSHPKEKRVCEYCGKIFRNEYSTKRHKPTCRNNQNSKRESFIKCAHCETLSTDRHTAKRHEKACEMKQHIKNNPCQCFFCKQSFSNPDETTQHYKEIHPDKEIVCKYCERLFTNKYATKKHEQVCLINKNYKEANDYNKKDPYQYHTAFNQYFPPFAYTYTQEANDYNKKDPDQYHTGFNQYFPPSLYTHTQEANDSNKKDPPPYPTDFNQHFPSCAYTHTHGENDPNKQYPDQYPADFKQYFPPSLYTHTQEANGFNPFFIPCIFCQKPLNNTPFDIKKHCNESHSQEEALCETIRQTFTHPLKLENFLNEINELKFNNRVNLVNRQA